MHCSARVRGSFLKSLSSIMKLLCSFSVFKSKVPDETVSKKQCISSKSTSARREKQKEQSPVGEAKEPDDGRLGRAVEVLLGFPSSVILFVPPGIPCHKLDSFLNMYKAHCRNLLRAVACTAFDDVPVHLNHFWNGIPEHISPILDGEFIANVMETCDILFYEVWNVFICLLVSR